MYLRQLPVEKQHSPLYPPLASAQAPAGTQVLLPTSPGEAPGGRAADSAGSGSPPATHSSRTGQSLEPTARGGTWARGSGGLQERKALRHGLGHEPLLTPWARRPLHAQGGPRPRAVQGATAWSTLPPRTIAAALWGVSRGDRRASWAQLRAACQLPPLRRCSSPGAPTAARLEDGSLCWLPHPLGTGRGLAPAAPTSGLGPACLRARLLPSALHSWPHLQPQIPAALEAHFHFSLSCTGEGNGNPLQYSCLENPRDDRAWWAAVYGLSPIPHQ